MSGCRDARDAESSRVESMEYSENDESENDAIGEARGEVDHPDPRLESE